MGITHNLLVMRSFELVLVFSQCFGIFPLSNTKNENGASEMRFKIISFQFVYCVFVESFILFMILALIYHDANETKFTFSNFCEYFFLGSFCDDSIMDRNYQCWLHIFFSPCKWYLNGCSFKKKATTRKEIWFQLKLDFYMTVTI